MAKKSSKRLFFSRYYGRDVHCHTFQTGSHVRSKLRVLRGRKLRQFVKTEVEHFTQEREKEKSEFATFLALYVTCLPVHKTSLKISRKRVWFGSIFNKLELNICNILLTLEISFDLLPEIPSSTTSMTTCKQP